MPFYIVKEDITTLDVEAIVNSANPEPIIGEGVESSIYSTSGMELLEERKRIGTIPFKQCELSNGYNLKSKYVIHSVAPIYETHSQFREDIQETYLNVLKLAVKNNIESIAFPLLSSGANNAPRHFAIEYAIDTINRFIREYDLEVYLVLYKPYSSRRTKSVSLDVRKYLDKNNIRQRRKRESSFRDFTLHKNVMHSEASIDDIEVKEETFQECLFNFIDEKELSEVDVYKNANMSRKLFSKIRSDKNYLPSKRNIIALCIALRLDLEESNYLLEKAGYTLSDSIEFDLIIKFFIEKRIYRINEINLVLFEYCKPLLGSK